MSCMQNWFIQREKTMYILLTSWLRFHIKKKKISCIYFKWCTQFTISNLVTLENFLSYFQNKMQDLDLFWYLVKEKYNTSHRYVINYYRFYHIWLLWTINRSRSDLSKTSLFEFVSKISGSVQQDVFHRRKKI